jgi:hypothetical protein
LKPDGSNPVRLSDGTANEAHGEWSPDGTRIVYSSDRSGDFDDHEIWVMNADGTNPIRLTDSPGIAASIYPRWSPDGSRIVYAASDDFYYSGWDIYVMNADGSGKLNLTNSPGEEQWSSWGPYPPGSQPAITVKPRPTVSSVSPESVPAGSQARTLTVNGTKFLAGSIVRWNGGNRITTYLSPTQLEVLITAEDMATAGSAYVSVINPEVGGCDSALFTITPAGGASELTIVTGSPLSNGTVGEPYVAILQAGGGTPPYTWAIMDGFLPLGLELNENTGEISGTSTAAGSFGFTGQVTDSGGASATKAFILDVAPASGAANTPYEAEVVITTPDSTNTCTNYTYTGDLPPGLTLDASGLLHGTPTNGGTYTFTIQCAFSQSGETVAKEFTLIIQNPVPGIVQLDPDRATPGGPDFTLIVRGVNFVLDSKVYWDDAERPTTYVSANELRAAISAADIASAGIVPVKVVNPAPGGGSSNPFDLPVTTLRIVTDSLPEGMVGVPYSTLLEAEGGVSPYRWSGPGRTLRPAG